VKQKFILVNLPVGCSKNLGAVLLSEVDQFAGLFKLRTGVEIKFHPYTSTSKAGKRKIQMKKVFETSLTFFSPPGRL